MKKITLFCIIPALNEAGNLEVLTNRLNQAISPLTKSFTILYVIQGDDDSLSIIKKLKKQFPSKLQTLYFEKALGIGKAYKEGYKVIPKSATHVLTLDADLNHDPEMIKSFFLAMSEKNVDVVIGSRFIKGGAFYDKRIWKRIVSFLTNRSITFLVRLGISDATSGYRLFKRDVIETILPKLSESGYPSYLEVIANVSKNGFKIAEVPIIYTPRIWGKSKMGKIKTSLDYLKFLPKLIFNF